MPPQSRGPSASAGIPVLSKSTPDLPTLRRLSMSSDAASKPDPTITSPSDSAADKENTLPEEYSSDSDSDDKNITKNISLRRHYSHQPSRFHQTYLHPSASQLFPPFYNRPPTPLPPSPSLTSLLRPPFSAHTSHHTTPESSDVESTVGGSTAAAVEKSAQAATTIPRADPKVPTYEYYGFTLYLASSATFLMYILWAFLPSPFLHQLGIDYYPDRWWALAFPAWLVVSLIYIYIALASYNTGYLTLPMASIENLVDEASHVAVVDKDGNIIRPKKLSRFQASSKSGKQHTRHSSGSTRNPFGPLGGKDVNWRNIWDEGTDAVLDIPIGGVCEILYGAGRQTEDTK
jgi:phosphatidylinositol N-acetylglucosaminyltransferase subunit P